MNVNLARITGKDRWNEGKKWMGLLSKLRGQKPISAKITGSLLNPKWTIILAHRAGASRPLIERASYIYSEGDNAFIFWSERNCKEWLTKRAAKMYFVVAATKINPEKFKRLIEYYVAKLGDFAALPKIMIIPMYTGPVMYSGFQAALKVTFE